MAIAFDEYVPPQPGHKNKCTGAPSIYTFKRKMFGNEKNYRVLVFYMEI